MAGNNNVKAAEKGGKFKFFRELKAEVERIFVLIYVIYVGGLDYIFQNLFEVILKLK